MAGTIRITYEELYYLASQLEKSRDTLESTVQAQDNQIKSIAESSWLGNSATKFTEYWRQWTAGQTQIRSSLEQMPILLRDLARRMQEADR